MEIPEEIIAAATRDYAIFAYDEGTPGEIRQARSRFNEQVGESFRNVTKSALMGGFDRPTSEEFRLEFTTQCRKYLRRKGTI